MIKSYCVVIAKPIKARMKVLKVISSELDPHESNKTFGPEVLNVILTYKQKYPKHEIKHFYYQVMYAAGGLINSGKVAGNLDTSGYSKIFNSQLTSET